MSRPRWLLRPRAAAHPTESPTRRGPRRLLTALAAAGALVLATGLSASAASSADNSGAHPASVPAPATANGNLGPNVYVFTPSMSQSSIQTTLNTIATQQVPNQFGTQRYALLFDPGTYGSVADPLIFQVGYYTQVAGLGRSRADGRAGQHQPGGAPGR